jgi:hypothetical protein
MQNFDVLTWPPQSPNLNPMEHVWALVKKESKWVSNTNQRNALIVEAYANFFPFHHSLVVLKVPS